MYTYSFCIFAYPFLSFSLTLQCYGEKHCSCIAMLKKRTKMDRQKRKRISLYILFEFSFVICVDNELQISSKYSQFLNKNLKIMNNEVILLATNNIIVISTRSKLFTFSSSFNTIKFHKVPDMQNSSKLFFFFIFFIHVQIEREELIKNIWVLTLYPPQRFQKSQC